MSARSAENNYYAIQNYLRDKRPALFPTGLGFPYELTEEDLANQLGVTLRQAERIVAALKKKAGLTRRGSDKTGEWYFPQLRTLF